MLPPQVNTWDTDVDLPVILAMADSMIERREITETRTATVLRVVGMRGTVTVTEEIGEIAGVRPQPTGAVGDTRLDTGVGGVTRGAR